MTQPDDFEKEIEEFVKGELAVHPFDDPTEGVAVERMDEGARLTLAARDWTEFAAMLTITTALGGKLEENSIFNWEGRIGFMITAPTPDLESILKIRSIVNS